MNEEREMNESVQNDNVQGDKVQGDKVEGNKIEINYKEKIEATKCPLCLSDFNEDTIRIKNRIKCGNCEKWSYDPHFDKSLALIYPNVSQSDHDEFTRLVGRIDNEIKLSKFDDALKNSEKLTKMSPQAPHGFLYNALSLYYSQDKDDIVNQSASNIIKRLELAKEKIENGATEAAQDYELFSSAIAYNYFYLLRGIVGQIHNFYYNKKNGNKYNILEIYYKHIKEFYTCYKIFPEVNFLIVAIEHLHGYNNFAWFEFKPNNSDYIDIKKVITNKEYSIVEKYKGVSYLISNIETEIKKFDPQYALPELKIDCSKITGIEKPVTINSLFQDITILSENISKWDKICNEKIDKSKKVSLDEIIKAIQESNPTDYNHLRILRDTERREIYYYVNYSYLAIKREKVNYKLFLFPAVKSKFFDITKKSTWGVRDLKKYDDAISFSSKEADIQVVETNEYRDVPIRHDKKYIYNPQPTYFNPDQTGTHTCSGCNGVKYLVCKVCNGRHKIPCETCRQQGYINCNNCQTRGTLTCKKCSGSGYVMKGNERVICEKSVFGHLGLESGGCNGTGRVTCPQCEGHGKIKCKDCKGETYIECSECYGDQNNRETYGKVDCKECHASGEIGIFNTIRPTIIQNSESLVIAANRVVDKNDLIVSYILSMNTNRETPQEVYFSANEQKESGYTDLAKSLCQAANDYYRIYFDKYPIIIQEKIYFEAIPVLKIKFKHILSNKTHDLSVVNYGEVSPKIIYYSNFKEPLKFKTETDDIFGRAFFQKSYIDKIDKRNEIILMIYMAKADGIIEEKEKEIIERNIERIDNFTKKEQEFIFNLMDIATLPPLDPKYCIFSSDAVENVVKSRLIELIAEADGEYESSEKIAFRNIANVLNANRGKRLNFFTAFLTTWQVSVPILFILLVIILMVL